MSQSKFAQTTIGPRKTSEYGTPISLFKTLDAIFQFVLDPCALAKEPERWALIHYNKEQDGLLNSWPHNTFINPPFGTKDGENIRSWIKKFIQESDNYPDQIYVMLLPTRLESNWFQDLIWSDLKTDIYVMRGRLSFYNPETNRNNDPHPIGSMLLIRCINRLVDYAKLQTNIPGIFLHRGL